MSDPSNSNSRKASSGAMSFEMPGTCPLPTDFVNYYPFACGQFKLGYDVVISKMVQSEYVGTNLISKSKKPNTPKNDARAHASRMEIVSETEVIQTSSRRLFAANPVIKIIAICNLSDRLTHLTFEKIPCVLPKKMLLILGLFIRFHPYLTTLTIRTKIDHGGIYELSNLIAISHIVELHLDGCFVKEANYHLLLNETCNLKVLSLARCTLTDTVLKTITDKLDHLYSASKSLISLNVSSNRITDVGAVYIGQALRTNRHLAHLNISGNFITDDGMSSILAAMLEFPVKNEELIETRGRRFEYLKTRIDKVNDLVVQITDEEFDKLRKKTTKLKKTTSIQLVDRVVFPPDIIRRIHERAEVQADLNLGKFLDPFYPLSIKDDVIYTYGNNTLQSLNVAYNSITILSARKILEVLDYQRLLNRKPRGLLNLNLEGNPLPLKCPELLEINSLLELAATDCSLRNVSVVKKSRTRSIGNVKI